MKIQHNHFSMPQGLPSPMNMSKSEILDLLLTEEYGKLPPRAHTVSAEILSTDKKFYWGKAELVTLNLKCTAEFGEFSFPVKYLRPTAAEKPVPCFIHINFRPDLPDRYQPCEEILDAGYTTLTFCYQDITSDDGDFTNGLAGVIYKDGKRGPYDCGKISLWAWAALAVMDYAQTLPEIDHSAISVVGHSRLGKTALLTGALDERFLCAFSNDSGCSGASLSRENTGETIKKITDQFPYWFTENYKKYSDNETALPFDQHYLLAANLPHMVYVASASLDEWACPKNEFLSCVAASDYYKAAGKKGFIAPDRDIEIGDAFHEGDIGYHIRYGKHFISRTDWNRYIEFLNRHLSK